ncbi:tetratricopeptide repeat protein [Patescibacteria group bacterium]|nr:tetratricopeptide repeat protein [Patescibacteria group bacterium]MBU4367867.1 tetratricopeptide repeat protein [Patescibacteria group bacterium]MBU4461956.1 tetratricopeptide repeat protein [Patescibacteria group bacterium]MCG2699899.1 tetratricopeptide repeat protein [Candidatus Parcubacteria bacterium]
MPKENSFFLKVCDFISKYSIYALVFLLPIFFLPWTSDVLDFNKQTLLLFLVFISLFAWMLKVLISRELSINLNKTNIIVAVLFIVYLFSTIFSLWRYGSFWGWPQNVSESLITLLGLSVFYFLVSNLFNKKEIFQLTLTLAFSAFLSLIIGFFQIVGLFLLPFNFAKTTLFNTIGTAGTLGFFIVVLLPLIFSLLTRKKSLGITLIWAVIFTVVLLLTLNYHILWWLVILGCALLMIFGIQRRDLFDSRWLILPMFFLALSLFFIILKPSIGLLPTAPIEFSLSQKTSLNIDWQTLKQNPILGSGPGTFSYDFAKYKNIDFNKSIFWNFSFGGATSKVLTVLGTTGILGVLAFLALMIYVAFCGIKFFFINKFSDDYWNITLGVFIGFIVLSIGFFLNNGGLTLDFLYFFLIAALIGLISEERKKYLLEPSSLITLGVTFAFTLCFIFGLGLLILIGQKYVAEINYNQGLVQLQKGESDAGIRSIEKAVGLNPSSDLYLRQLSQIYLAKIGQEAARTDISQEEISKNIQLLVGDSINAAKIASDVNPKNIANWSVRGLIYQNLIGVVPGVEDWAINSYESAEKLDPNNPYYPAQKGIVYLIRAAALTEEKEGDKPQILSQAKEQLDKAIQLKSDYAPARFQMAMVSQAEGKTDEAIKGLEDTKQYAPNDIGLAFQLGILYYQKKDWKSAQGEFERAIGISPNYSNALYFSGLTYYEQGQTNKAIEKIKKVLEINPDNETVAKVLANLKAGKKPLEGIGQQAPIEENPQ